MRNPLAKVIVAPLAVLMACSAVTHAQGRGAVAPAQGRGGGRGAQPGFISAGIPAMPNPPGPAPKRELTGTWVGAMNYVPGPYPAMTPAGEAAKKRNKFIARGSDTVDAVESTNDPFAMCDPLGFPRVLLAHWLSWRGGIEFLPSGSNRMVMLFEHQRVWREIWMDGRQLPAKVDARGFPDARFYGYSVGRWEADNVFVIDTVGLDDRSWLDEAGLPHSIEAKLQERWTRVDQYNLALTVTVDDPQYFTKPFQLFKADYYWKKDQNVREELCIASEAIQYRDSLAGPSGYGYKP